MRYRMRLFSTKIGVYFIIGVFAILGCKQSNTREKTSRVEVLPYYNDPTFKPNWLEPDSDTIKEFHVIPDFSLVNQLGDTITGKTFDGKIYVTNFFFTSCPGICPKMTENMEVLQEEFKNDDSVLLLSHSVTPEMDSVPVLQNYADINGVLANKWHLATGNRKQIYDLGRDAYFVEEDMGIAKSEDDFLHTENFVLIDKDKYIRGIYNGLNKTAIAQLVADIETLKLQVQ